MKKTNWQYKLQWEVPLQMPTKMCCACAVQHSTPNLTKQKRKTHSFQVSSFASRVTPHSANQMWQPWDHGVHGRDLLVHLHYLPARICGVELGIQAPHPPNLQLLSTCEQIAEAFYFQIPHCYYVIRDPSPKYSHILGYQRKILLGLNGSIQYKDLEIKLNEFILKESGCHAVNFNKSTPHIHHAHLGTQGNPLLSWTTSWLQLSPQTLVSVAQHLKDATGTLGLLLLKKGLFTLECKKNQRNFKVQGIANSSELLLSIQQLEMEKSKENIRAETEDQAYQTIKTLNKSSRKLELIGWREKRATERENELPFLKVNPQDKQKLPHLPPLRLGWRQHSQLRNVPPDIIDGLLTSGRVDLFEKMIELNPQTSIQIWGELLFRWSSALEKKGILTKYLAPERYFALSALYGMGLCHREALFDLLAYTALYPDHSVRELLVNQMGIKPISERTLQSQLPEYLEGELPKAKKWKARESFWMGRLMSKLQGSIEGRNVRWELYRYFSQNPPTPLDLCPFPPPGKKKKYKKGRPIQKTRAIS